MVHSIADFNDRFLPQPSIVLLTRANNSVV